MCLRVRGLVRLTRHRLFRVAPTLMDCGYTSERGFFLACGLHRCDKTTGKVYRVSWLTTEVFQEGMMAVIVHRYPRAQHCSLLVNILFRLSRL